MTGDPTAREITACVVCVGYVCADAAVPVPSPWSVLLAVAVAAWAVYYARS